MTDPTHRHKATGVLVFPQGYRAANIEPLPAGYWAAQDLIAAWAALRTERDRRLLLTDREIALPDFPISATRRAALLIYRQTLRDLPENTTDPLAPAWPVPPPQT